MTFSGISRARRPVLAAALALGLASIAVGVGMRGKVVAAQPATPPAVLCGNLVRLTLAPQLSRSFDLAQPNAQIEADCIAWQSFIALNWPVAANAPCEPDGTAPVSDFGKPNGVDAVWESYPVASSLFTANPSFCTPAARARTPVKILRSVSKLGDSVIVLNGVPMEAFSTWLTDQAHGLTYYEIHVNKDEADYIKFNGLNTIPGQAVCAAEPGGLILPRGLNDTDCNGKAHTYGDNVGSIETKSSWIAIDPSQSNRYFTAKALIYPPSGSGPPRSATVGLVGMHIVRKMPGANRMVWATFEHVDNDPDAPNGRPLPRAGKRYNYYNPRCNPSTDPLQCALNSPPPTSAPYTASVQVARLHPIGSKAKSVNVLAYKLIRQNAPNSVFLNYQLVDAMWPTALTGDIKPGSAAPLVLNNMTSESRAMANTTMETYFQTVPANDTSGSQLCLNCHAFATIATPSTAQRTARTPAGRPARLIQIGTRPRAQPANGAAPSPTATPYASDYSFIFEFLGQ